MATTSAFEVYNAGLISYQEGLTIQEKYVTEVQTGNRPDTLILCQHSPVITMGTGTHQENLLASRETLEKSGVELFETGRGGDITYHGPGQLVGYPIFDLKKRGSDLHRYIRDLETAIILSLRPFSITAETVEGLTGVWVENRKIAAIGIRVQRWVSSHGFAINVNTQLDAFNMIVPCGISDKTVTSIAAETGKQQPMGVAESFVTTAMRRVFG